MTTSLGAPTIDVATLTRWLADGEELAVLDVRDAEVVGYASPLFATNLPAARVLAELDRFVPRRSVRTVLVDDGSGVAEVLVEDLRADDWTGVVALSGGIPAWLEQPGDLPTFDTPGLDFSTAVQRERSTPVVDVEQLDGWRGAGEDVVVIDTRTLPEFERGHVPGAIAVPGAELLLRIDDLVASPDTRVVVSCAGLPRAILGAQTLIDAGLPNPVSYLHDGTRAWTESGRTLEIGSRSLVEPAGAAAHGRAVHKVDALSKDDAIAHVDLATATSWLDDPHRTTYLLDVRTPAEFEAAHVPGSISSEGGQLLGVAYRTIAVRAARVVLVDDLTGARAAVVAHWLQRRGYELAILLHDFSEH